MRASRNRTQRNNEKLIADLAPHADKSAYYYCVLVYVRHADDPQPVIADGRWNGVMLDDAARRGRLRLRPVLPPAGAGQIPQPSCRPRTRTGCRIAARPCARWWRS
jgi:hypothetical protein